MKLLRVRIQNFRNIESADVSLSEGTSVISGPNGQGKTNFLEALYALSTLRPLRGSRFDHLIRFGAESARVEGDCLIQGIARTIAFEIGRGERTAWIDGKRAKSLEEYFGGVTVVAFTPDDLSIVKGGPEGRRRFLDRAVFNRFPSHLDVCRRYLKALRQRNQLLRDAACDDWLLASEAALVQAGAEVIIRRLMFLSEISEVFQRSFSAIAPSDGGASLAHSPLKAALPHALIPDRPTIAAAFQKALDERRTGDRERGFTSVGPHADDLEIRIGDRSARAFASQGQQRAAILAFKIAELENLQNRLGTPPLLLLDDVSSELDPERNGYLMDCLAQSRVQCVLTTTDEKLVSPQSPSNHQDAPEKHGTLESRLFWRVQGGHIEPAARGEGEAPQGAGTSLAPCSLPS